jgi:phosphatidylethanolamine-binding protein (PEBP) family uncharacterized protein
MPARYTCNGADISPPLEWRNVPAKAAELFLIALELHGPGLTARGASILWAVAGIQPTEGKVAAGTIPPGAVVGTNAAGKAAWGGLCSAKVLHHHIAFLMYALPQKLGLTTGFNPALARKSFKGTAVATGLTLGTYRSA